MTELYPSKVLHFSYGTKMTQQKVLKESVSFLLILTVNTLNLLPVFPAQFKILETWNADVDCEHHGIVSSNMGQTKYMSDLVNCNLEEQKLVNVK